MCTSGAQNCASAHSVRDASGEFLAGELLVGGDVALAGGLDDDTLHRIAADLLANPVIEDWVVTRVAVAADGATAP